MEQNMSKEIELAKKQDSIQTFIFSPRMGKQLDLAITKWLSPDRFLRICYSSILKNPKLLECTQESIMASIMNCAQVGLEPILGRAHLIPYGKECQMQPGYQGLVDLARRTGEIADVYAEAVYEKDEFSITLGQDKKLTHIPNYIEDRGEIIGAYTVWVMTDGTKPFTFMPIHEIYKSARSKSPAFLYADAKGGKKNSPWHTDEAEQCKKTVVKRHSKLAPASVEHMKAVELDNQAETGEKQVNPFVDMGTIDAEFPEDPGAKPTENNSVTISFREQIPVGTNRAELDSYLKVCAHQFSKTVKEIEIEAAQDFGAFLESFNRYQQAKKQQGSGNNKTSSSSVGDSGGQAKKDPLDRKNWERKKKSFPTYVFGNLKLIKTAPESVIQEMREHWDNQNFDAPFPIEKTIEGEVVDAEYTETYSGKVDAVTLRTQILEGCDTMKELESMLDTIKFHLVEDDITEQEFTTLGHLISEQIDVKQK